MPELKTSLVESRPLLDVQLKADCRVTETMWDCEDGPSLHEDIESVARQTVASWADDPFEPRDAEGVPTGCGWSFEELAAILAEPCEVTL